MARFVPLLGLLLIGAGVAVLSGLAAAAVAVGGLLWVDAYLPDPGKRR